MNDLRRTYIFDCFESVFSFLSIQFAIAVFVEQFWQNKVSIADNTIAIEVKTDIGL